MDIHAIDKIGLTTVAWMTNLARGNFHIRKRDLSIPSDRYDGSGPKRVQKPHQQMPTGLAFLARVTAVGHRVIPLMGMKWKCIPEENGSLQRFQNLPNHGGCSLCNCGTFCRPRQRGRSKELCVVDEMHLVSKRKTGSPPPAITEVPGNPHRLHATPQGCNENEPEIATADSRGVGLIVLIAGIGIWVEDTIKSLRCHALDETVDMEGIRLHLNQSHPLQITKSQ